MAIERLGCPRSSPPTREAPMLLLHLATVTLVAAALWEVVTTVSTD